MFQVISWTVWTGHGRVSTFGDPPLRFITVTGDREAMGSQFKFIHCADLHLGSRFKGVSSSDPELGRAMRESTWVSLGRIVDLAVSERVSAVVISGDVYDDENALPSTRMRFTRELARIPAPVFIARGNHDSATSWDSAVPYPSNVHEFGPEPCRYAVGSGPGSFDVVGVSFSVPHEGRNLASMLSGDPDRFTVACVHCDVDSVSEGYPYAPCRMSDLRGRGVDYWALGHIHRRQVVSESPYAVYPGNIQGRSVRETGEKGAYLVTVTDGRVSELRFVPTQGMVWRDLEVDITGRDMQSLAADVSSSVLPGDICRLRFTGSGDLDAVLRTETGDAVAALSSASGCTVASVVLGCSPSVELPPAGGPDILSRAVGCGEDLRDSDVGAILDAVCANGMAARHRDLLSSLGEEGIRGMVDDAVRLLAVHLGAGR